MRDFSPAVSRKHGRKLRQCALSCSAEEKLKASGKPCACRKVVRCTGRKQRETGIPVGGKVPLRECPARMEVISSLGSTQAWTEATTMYASCSAEKKLKISVKPYAVGWEFSAAGRNRRQTGAPLGRKVPLRECPARTEVISSSSSTQTRAAATAICAPCSAEEKLKASGKPCACREGVRCAGRNRRQTGASVVGNVSLWERPARTELVSSSDSIQATAKHAQTGGSSAPPDGIGDKPARPLSGKSAAGTPCPHEGYFLVGQHAGTGKGHGKLRTGGWEVGGPDGIGDKPACPLSGKSAAGAPCPHRCNFFIEQHADTGGDSGKPRAAGMEFSASEGSGDKVARPLSGKSRWRTASPHRGDFLIGQHTNTGASYGNVRLLFGGREIEGLRQTTSRRQGVQCAGRQRRQTGAPVVGKAPLW